MRKATRARWRGAARRQGREGRLTASRRFRRPLTFAPWTGTPHRAVIGAGQWGTTLALHLAQAGPVILLARDEEQARSLTEERRNSRYLPEVDDPVEVEITADPAALADAHDLVIFAVPTMAMRETAERTRDAPRRRRSARVGGQGHRARHA